MVVELGDIYICFAWRSDCSIDIELFDAVGSWVGAIATAAAVWAAVASLRLALTIHKRAANETANVVMFQLMPEFVSNCDDALAAIARMQGDDYEAQQAVVLEVVRGMSTEACDRVAHIVHFVSGPMLEPVLDSIGRVRALKRICRRAQISPGIKSARQLVDEARPLLMKLVEDQVLMEEEAVRDMEWLVDSDNVENNAEAHPSDTPKS